LSRYFLFTIALFNALVSRKCTLTIRQAIHNGFSQRHHKEQPDFPSSALSEAGTTITTYS
jgi:hypothetical protein